MPPHIAFSPGGHTYPSAHCFSVIGRHHCHAVTLFAMFAPGSGFLSPVRSSPLFSAAGIFLEYQQGSSQNVKFSSSSSLFKRGLLERETEMRAGLPEREAQVCGSAQAACLLKQRAAKCTNGLPCHSPVHLFFPVSGREGLPLKHETPPYHCLHLPSSSKWDR